MVTTALLVLARFQAGALSWQETDIGITHPAGSSSISTNSMIVSGSGADIFGTADAFHFVYQSLNGDGLLIARVNSVANTEPWAKAGIMFRETLAAGAANAFVLSSAQQGPGFQARTVTGGGTSFKTGTFVTNPLWLKLVRSNLNFSAYQSLDGKNWTFMGSTNIAMAQNILIGFAVTSHQDGTLCSANFTNVDSATVIVPPASPVGLVATAVASNRINLRWSDQSRSVEGFEIERLVSYTNYVHVATVPANVTNFSDQVTAGFSTYYYRVRATAGAGDSPYSNVAKAITDVLPSPWNNQDVGNVGAPGSANFQYGEFIADAAGSDISGTEDSFQFIYQSWNGDGELVARVTSIGNTDPNAKAGLMFRQSVEANSPNVSMLLTAQNGTVFQARAQAGATTSVAAGSSAATPLWLKLVRTGTECSGYQSADGTNWILMGRQTVALSAPILAGMATCAHNNSGQVAFEAWYTNVRLQAASPSSAVVASAPTMRMLAPKPNGAMQFELSGTPGSTFAIEASTNLVNWVLLTNQINQTGTMLVEDSEAPKFSQRFYRAAMR